MNVTRIYLVLSALIWAGFGVVMLVNPDLTGVGLEVANPDGRIEIRGFYGGLELGIAAFLFWAAKATARHRAGLMAATLIIGCLAAGRVVGIAIEGGTSAMMMTFLSLEVVAAVWGSWLLRRRE